MKVAWTRGLTRLYLLVVGGWLFFCFGYTPWRTAVDMQRLCDATMAMNREVNREDGVRPTADDLADEGRCFQQATYPYHLRNMLRQVGSLAGAAFIVGIPVGGYVILRLAAALTAWLVAGFRADEAGGGSRPQ